MQEDTQKVLKNFGMSLISIFFTIWGVCLLFYGDITNGLLSLIVGELTDPRSKCS